MKDEIEKRLKANDKAKNPVNDLPLFERQNRELFKNYVYKDNEPWTPSYQSTYDNSMDRPMLFLGSGATQREISTDLAREIIDQYPQFFKGVDQSNYARLQESMQEAFRRGDFGPHVFDNLVLRKQGVDPTGKSHLFIPTVTGSMASVR